MSTINHTSATLKFNPQNPATWLKPGEQLVGADGRDWSWCYVWFKEVPGFPGYSAGSNGTVWSCKRSPVGEPKPKWKLMSSKPNCDGYIRVSLRKDMTYYKMSIQEIILETFVGPRPHGHCACHFPSPIRSDNRLCNLQWGTMKENHKHREIHGNTPRGIRSGHAKLNPDRAEFIRELYTSGRTPQSIADEISVGISTVRRVLSGDAWDNGRGSILEHRKRGCSLRKPGLRRCPPRQAWLPFMLDWRTKILSSDLCHIKSLRNRGYTLKDIADVYGSSAPTICDILKRT